MNKYSLFYISTDFLFTSAVIGNVYHHPDDRAITRLSEEFGSYKYIDFEGASSTSSLRNNEW